MSVTGVSVMVAKWGGGMKTYTLVEVAICHHI